jgi:hypothetical protein
LDDRQIMVVNRGFQKLDAGLAGRCFRNLRLAEMNDFLWTSERLDHNGAHFRSPWMTRRCGRLQKHQRDLCGPPMFHRHDKAHAADDLDKFKYRTIKRSITRLNI